MSADVTLPDTFKDDRFRSIPENAIEADRLRVERAAQSQREREDDEIGAKEAVRAEATRQKAEDKDREFLESAERLLGLAALRSELAGLRAELAELRKARREGFIPLDGPGAMSV